MTATIHADDHHCDGAGEGVKNKQPSVTVGACRELDALLGLGVNSSQRGRFGWRR